MKRTTTSEYGVFSSGGDAGKGQSQSGRKGQCLPPESKDSCRLSKERKQEMLEFLYGEMERRESSRRSGYTRLLEYAWKGVAVVFIVFCASWLLIPGNKLIAKYDALNVKCPSTAEQMNQADYYCGESLDFKLYELGRNLENSISNVTELVDKDLTGF